MDKKTKEPPKGLFGSLRYLGPGLILSASIVGSGELIATTALGAKAGFAVLWVLILGCLIKVCLLYTSPSPRDLSTSRMPSSA